MRFLLILALFAMLAAPAMALSNSTDVCIDSNTSYHYDYIYNGTDSTVLSNTLVPTKCAFGCNSITGQCNVNPMSAESTSLFFFLFPITALVVLYIMNSTKPEDWPLHLLGLGIALFLILIPFGTLAESMPAQFQGAYQFLLTATILIMAYYVIKFIATALQAPLKGKVNG